MVTVKITKERKISMSQRFRKRKESGGLNHGYKEISGGRTKMKKRNIEMSNVCKELIGMKFRKSDRISDTTKKFFGIMRKYNIRMGTKRGKGVDCSNPEWVSCETLFLDSLTRWILWNVFMFLDKEIPKDLRAYEEETQ